MSNGGLILWNAIAVCEMFKTSWQTGKLHTKDDSENHLKAWSFRLVQWLSIRMLHEDQSRLHQCCLKVVPGICLDLRFSRTEIGRDKFWKQTLKNWRRWTLRKFILEESINAKEVRTPQNGEPFIVPITDGTAKLLGKDMNPENPLQGRNDL